MDPLLIRFHRQYFQQIQNLTYPPPKLLIHPDIQDQLYRRFFDGPQRPSAAYQRRVLKELIRRIESAITDPDEDAVSDKLMEHISHLSTITESDPAAAASEPQLIIYTLPELISSSSFPSLPAAEIQILETPRLLAAQSDTGLRTWEASLHLATYLHANPLLVEKKNIIELGAGTGFLSLLCAGPLRASCVLATDGAPHVVERMEGNFIRNREGLFDRDRGEQPTLSARVLDWGETETLHDVLDWGGAMPAYDLVLGADITYHPDVVPILAELLRALMTGSFAKNDTQALISATVRNEMTLRVFKDACVERNLCVETVDFLCPSEREQDGFFHEQAFPIVIMRIMKLGA